MMRFFEGTFNLNMPHLSEEMDSTPCLIRNHISYVRKKLLFMYFICLFLVFILKIHKCFHLRVPSSKFMSVVQMKHSR